MLKKILVGMTLVVAGLSLTACGHKDKPLSENKPKISIKSPAQTVISENKDAANAKLLMSSYVGSINKQLSDTQKSLKDTFKEISVASENDSSLIITYVFAEQVTMSADDQKKVDDSLKKLHQSIVDGMVRSKIVDPKLKVVYNNPDGSNLVKEDFKADPIATTETSSSKK